MFKHFFRLNFCFCICLTALVFISGCAGRSSSEQHAGASASQAAVALKVEDFANELDSAGTNYLAFYKSEESSEIFLNYDELQGRGSMIINRTPLLLSAQEVKGGDRIFTGNHIRVEARGFTRMGAGSGTCRRGMYKAVTITVDASVQEFSNVYVKHCTAIKAPGTT